MNVAGERLLLKRCNLDDPAAQQLFSRLSYSNEVDRAVRETLVANSYSPIGEEQVDALIKLCISQVYQNWQTLPRRWSSLRGQIRKLSVVVTCMYIERELG